MNLSYNRSIFILSMVAGIFSCGPISLKTVDELLSMFEQPTDPKILIKLLKKSVQLIKLANIF